jgi:hypothetical protein
LLLEITRHGARTPVGKGSKLLNTTWETGDGQLTWTGERQHYLQGVRLRRKYVDELKFLPEEFDPRFFYIRATDYNRTIMSAYSQMLGLYPLKKGPVFYRDDRRSFALPPFDVDGGASDFIQQYDVLKERYNPFPIHVATLTDDYLLRGYSTGLCPIIEDLKAKAFEEGHKRTKESLEPLYDEMLKVWGITKEDVHLDGAEQYLDTYIMANFEQKPIENDLSLEAQELIDKYFWDLFYDGIYGNPKVAYLASTTFLNYVIDNFKSKVSAYEDSSKASEFHKNIRYIYLSAHDTTVAAYLAALDLQHSQKSLPPLASLTLIELFKRGDKYFLNWNMDGEFLNINNNCSSNGD